MPLHVPPSIDLFDLSIPAGSMGREQEQVGIRLFAPLERREDVRAVVIDGEALQFGIRVALIVAINLSRIVARSDARAANTQSHPRRMEQLVKERFACLSVHLMEGVTRSVGERGTETQNWLT